MSLRIDDSLPIMASGNYSLRSGTAADLEFALALNWISTQRYATEMPGWNEATSREEMQRRWAADPYQIIQVDDRRAGILFVTERNGLRVLKHIELLPEFQGRGIGTAVIGDVIAAAHRDGLGITLYVLTANPARRLYERFGFVVTETVDTGLYGVKYRMDLATPISSPAPIPLLAAD
jgi:ribosomal protein S18 acetylase RimI-like enzyme